MYTLSSVGSVQIYSYMGLDIKELTKAMLHVDIIGYKIIALYSLGIR